MGRPNYITTRGLARITRELEWLRKVERPKITAEVRYAASLGDRSENAEYIYGKKRLREIDRRTRFLIGRLDHVIAVDPGTQRGPTILFGATVVCEDAATGAEHTWRIYGEDEVDPDRGILSLYSPIARALLGKQEGDEVSVRTPGGTRELEILAVRYDPQEPLPDGLEAWKIPTP